MGIVIEESGEQFGPFKHENFFYIEKSKFYDNGAKGLKTVEFVLVDSKKTNLVLVEAKTSAPNVNNPGSVNDVENYILDIERKFYHSLASTVGLVTGRHKDYVAEFPENMKSIKYKDIKIILYLVITSFKEEWLSDWKDLLNRELSGFKRAWNIDEIYVLNTNLAKEMKLIV